MKQYLGPTHGFASFSTWEELVEAAEGGLLEESIWCELKAMPTPPGQGKSDANLEMARDLASLSLEGGLLIYGVKDKTFEVVGCDISGLDDRISSVAKTRVHPPLTPVILPALTDPENAERRALIVQVPPSPLAPHMVEDSYWGRSSNGKRKLSDAEVRSRMELRQHDDETFRARLEGMPGRDPLAPFIENYPTGNGHIYLLAEPSAHAQMAADVSIRDLLSNIHVQQRQGWPGLADCHLSGNDPYGRSFMASRDVLPVRYERSHCYVSTKDRDMSIEVVGGGGTARWENHNGVELDFVLAGQAAVLTLELLMFLNAVSVEAGYLGQWRVGLHMTNLRGKRYNSNRLGSYLPDFPEDTYTQSLVTNATEVAGNVEETAHRLLRGLQRGLGIENWSLSSVMGGA